MVNNHAGHRPPTRCDFNFALHYERRDYFGIIINARVLLRAREQGVSYPRPLFKLPSDRAVTYGIFAHPKNSEMVGSVLEPASPGSEASTRSLLSHPTTLPAWLQSA